jgi:hypothetical protein
MTDPEPSLPPVEETLKRIAAAVCYAAEEDEDREEYDEYHCIGRETLLGVLSDVRGLLWDAGIKIPTED